MSKYVLLPKWVLDCTNKKGLESVLKGFKAALTADGSLPSHVLTKNEKAVLEILVEELETYLATWGKEDV